MPLTADIKGVPKMSVPSAGPAHMGPSATCHNVAEGIAARCNARQVPMVLTNEVEMQ